jgi:hypothetical protein
VKSVEQIALEEGKSVQQVLEEIELARLIAAELDAEEKAERLARLQAEDDDNFADDWVGWDELR